MAMMTGRYNRILFNTSGFNTGYRIYYNMFDTSGRYNQRPYNYSAWNRRRRLVNQLRAPNKITIRFVRPNPIEWGFHIAPFEGMLTQSPGDVKIPFIEGTSVEVTERPVFVFNPDVDIPLCNVHLDVDQLAVQLRPELVNIFLAALDVDAKVYPLTKLTFISVIYKEAPNFTTIYTRPVKDTSIDEDRRFISQQRP